MLLVLRQLKRSYFDRREFRKYLLYALGETLLIVIGIIIALRLDNWNAERIDEESLRNYLATIATNIETDLDSIDKIRQQRLDAYVLSLRWLNFNDLSRRDVATVEEIAFASRVLNRAAERLYFIANTTGFDALKSSAVLDRLRGRDVEMLLYRYYDTVSRIDRIERDYNEQVRRLDLVITENWPTDLLSWQLANPQVLSPDRVDALQTGFRTLMISSPVTGLMAMPQSVAELLYEYEKAHLYGREIAGLVADKQLDLDAEGSSRVAGLYDPDDRLGNPELIIRGGVPWHSFHLINSDANDPTLFSESVREGSGTPFTLDSFVTRDDHIHVSHRGDILWAGLWLQTGATIADIPTKDYTDYDTLVLELRGDAGGERVTLNIEDIDDPMDGTSTRITIELTDEWKTFEIDLDEFETADFSKIIVPLGFIFFDEPVSFSIRNARYVRQGR